MLQSSNHYLRPDYLAAPSAAVSQNMDNKSSPLALLAQTCSAIGSDTTNPKLLAANIEKSTKSLKSSNGGGASGGSVGSGICANSNNSIDARDKSSPVSSHSSSVSTGSVEQQPITVKPVTSGAPFKPYESNNNHIRNIAEECATNLTSNQRSRTPKGGGSINGQRCDSNQSASSHRESPANAMASTTNGGLRRTPTANMGGALDLQQRLVNSSPVQQQQQQQQHQHQHQHQQRASSKESATASSPNGGQTRLQAASEAAMAAAAKEASYVKALHAAAAAAAAGNGVGVPTTSAGSPYYQGYATASTGGMPYPMDLMTASALMSPHHPMFKAAAMNPYLNYARLKGLDPSTAAAMMSPNICRDPYCTGCPSSPHFLNKAAGQPCPAGCPQCEANGAAAAKAAASNNSAGSNSGSNAAAAAAAAASSYHAQLAALAAASQLPYVCSWIGSDAAYCGKRFGNSDELFQHLRTHTASVPDSVLSAAAAGGIPPNHPLFQRTYPTPPLSPLSAARYHPYGKPSMLPPSLAQHGIPGLPPHPALAQYFSPYSLYGPRMGSSHP